MKKFALILVLIVAGCGIAKRQEIEVYTLKYQAGALPPASCKIKKSIEIGEPTAAPGLDGRRVAILEGQKFTYYRGVRWAATVPDMLQAIFVESFEKAGIYNSVNTDSDAASSDLVLMVDIRDFYVVNPAAPEIRLRLTAKLIDAETAKVLVTIPAQKNFKPAANETASIIEAFNNAARQASGEIVNKLQATCK